MQKVIQIQARKNFIFALCEDGKIWRLDLAVMTDKPIWNEIPLGPKPKGTVSKNTEDSGGGGYCSWIH
jgi:hypothetical protein